MWEVDGMQGLSVPVQNSMASYIFCVKNENVFKYYVQKVGVSPLTFWKLLCPEPLLLPFCSVWVIFQGCRATCSPAMSSRQTTFKPAHFLLVHSCLCIIFSTHLGHHPCPLAVTGAHNLARWCAEPQEESS